mgnify:FL=1
MSDLPSLGPRGEGWVAIQVALLAALGIAAPVTGRFATAAWTDPSGAATPVGLLVAGLAVATLAAGALLAVRGIVDLRDALTPTPPPRDDAELVEDGVYARARHPIYGGLIVASLAWAVLWLSSTGLLLAATVAVFFRLKSEREEAWLADRFAGYAAYRRRTRRFLPIPLRRAGG